jgi:FixJ family two-component response regulator
VQSAKALLAPPLDLVIADVRLPDGQGHQVLRAAMALSPIPVLVAISGKASASEAFSLARSGAVAFLEKPFGLAELERLLRSACDAHFRARDAAPLTQAAEIGLRELARRHGLTPRQVELLRHIVSGTPRAGLPQALGISKATCKALVRRVLERCGKKRLSELVPAVFSASPESGPETE